MQDGAIEPRRLERVVAALARQRAADKGDAGEAEEQAHLAQRVGEIDIGVRGDRLAARCGARRRSRALRSMSAIVVAARRMARRDDRQQARDARAATRDAPRRPPPPRPDGCWRRARPAGRQIGGAAPPARPCRAASGARGGLEVAGAGRRRARRARETAPPGSRLAPGTARKPPAPAAPSPAEPASARCERADSRALTSSSRDAARDAVASDQIGPQLGFDPDRQIGPPMVEKPFDRTAADRPARIDAGPAAAAAVPSAAPRRPCRSSSAIREAGRSASMRSISASTECASPTLAACTQTSGAGRPRPASDSQGVRRRRAAVFLAAPAAPTRDRARPAGAARGRDSAIEHRPASSAAPRAACCPARSRSPRRTRDAEPRRAMSDAPIGFGASSFMRVSTRSAGAFEPVLIKLGRDIDRLAPQKDAAAERQGKVKAVPAVAGYGAGWWQRRSARSARAPAARH